MASRILSTVAMSVSGPWRNLQQLTGSVEIFRNPPQKNPRSKKQNVLKKGGKLEKEALLRSYRAEMQNPTARPRTSAHDFQEHAPSHKNSNECARSAPERTRSRAPRQPAGLRHGRGRRCRRRGKENGCCVCPSEAGETDPDGWAGR